MYSGRFGDSCKLNGEKNSTLYSSPAKTVIWLGVNAIRERYNDTMIIKTRKPTLKKEFSFLNIISHAPVMNICSSVMSEIAALYVYGIYMFLNADVLKLTGAL